MEKNESSAAPPSKQKRRSRGEWLKEIRSLRDSGLSAKEYATKKGFVFSTLKYWMRILRDDVEARTKSAVPAFLPVSVLLAARAPESESTWLSRKVRQVCEGGLRALGGMKRETLRSPMSMPSLSNSPWILVREGETALLWPIHRNAYPPRLGPL
jgi:hypothetical protein